MITVYHYPPLFGLPDNNPYGLKVNTFLQLTGVDHTVKHIVDTSQAPRGQLPYLDDDGHIVSDSNRMIAYLTDKYQLGLDLDLTEHQRNYAFLLTRTLDCSLYWVMSYSRWQDPQRWPLFKQALLNENPDVPDQILDAARKYNMDRYWYQGIGRTDSEQVYQMGMADLNAIAAMLGDQPFIFGNQIHTIDASCYGFLANIFYIEIDTPLRSAIQSNQTLCDYVQRVRA